MGHAGRDIVGKAAEDMIEELNRAVAAEMNDAYRYRYLAEWVEGRGSHGVAEVFSELAEDEWKHAGKFLARIMQLGGRPVPSPAEFMERSYTDYLTPPEDRHALVRMIEESIEGERAAIRFYHRLAERAREHDPVTWRLAVEALADEVADEERLEGLLDEVPEPGKGGTGGSRGRTASPGGRREPKPPTRATAPTR